MSSRKESQKKARTIVVEDHPVVSDGLRQLIDKQPDLACVGVADNTSDAKRLVERSEADLMVLDLRLKGGDALDLIKTLRVEHPHLKVLVLSQYDELIYAERALRARCQISASRSPRRSGGCRTRSACALLYHRGRRGDDCSVHPLWRDVRWGKQPPAICVLTFSTDRFDCGRPPNLQLALDFPQPISGQIV